MKYIICDFDGTLCNNAHRVEWAQAKLWDEFHRRCLHDEPVEATVAILNAMKDRCNIVGLTGRNERYRPFTNTWLRSHNLDHLFTMIIMRGDNDFRPDTQFKLQAIDALVKSPDQILFAMDDRDGVVQAFRESGITTHQVKQGDY